MRENYRYHVVAHVTRYGSRGWRSNRGENVISVFSALGLFFLSPQNNKHKKCVRFHIQHTKEVWPSGILPPPLYSKELFNYLASKSAKKCQSKLFDVEYMWKYVEYSRLPWRPHIFVNILANGLRGLEWMGTHLYPPFLFCLLHISCWSSWETAMLSIMIIRNKPNWRIPRRRLGGKLRPEMDES